MLCDILEINEELKITVLYVTNRSFGSPHIRQKDRIYERRQNNPDIGYLRYRLFLVSFTTF